jgi:predicted regulator of Ras-like GTPase activity (Roadblock/LC7/MglB family)
MEAPCMTKKKKTVEDVAITEPLAIEEASSTQDLRASLEEIKSYEGVIGYILRNSTSASIDLKDPSKLIEYAILSSSAIDAGEELSELFNLGDVKNILVDGKTIKVVSFAVDDNKISIFMEKNADLERILKTLHRF